MRILFIGHSWHGSNARSFREALERVPGTIVSDVGEDHYVPLYRGLPMRIANRLLRPLQERELSAAVLRAIEGFRPDAVLVYKGDAITEQLISRIQGEGTPVYNIFPDPSPLVYGKTVRHAMGAYRAVFSAKFFHPAMWKSRYGYDNECLFVPHGYDPDLHLYNDPAPADGYDIALCATWRPEYHQLMRAVAGAGIPQDATLAIAGPGWDAHSSEFPPSWRFVGPRNGTAYVDFLRSARIVIAPVMREVGGDPSEPGDEDTARTYELAAAYTFFLHQRTDFVRSIYDEQHEVPQWQDGAELADLIARWLPDEPGRRRLADGAHRRAVPEYSLTHRAKTVLDHIQQRAKPAPEPTGS